MPSVGQPYCQAPNWAMLAVSEQLGASASKGAAALNAEAIYCFYLHPACFARAAQMSLYVVMNLDRGRGFDGLCKWRAMSLISC